jgi:hypothetical protein
MINPTPEDATMSDDNLRNSAARSRLMAALDGADADTLEQAATLIESATEDSEYDPVKEGKEAATRQLAARERAKDALR